MGEEPEESWHHQFVDRDAHGGHPQAAGNSLGDLAELDPHVPTACQYWPAGPFSSARRNKEATSRKCMAFHRFARSLGVFHQALLRRERDSCTRKPAPSVVVCAMLAIRTTEDCTPRSEPADDGGLHHVSNVESALVFIADGKGRVLLDGRPAQLPGASECSL